MTTDAQDLSNFDGVPITLYTFVRSTTPTVSGVPVTTYYRYTSADRDVVVGADTYTAVTISDEGIKQSGDEVSDQLTVTMPASLPVPVLFLAAPPEDPVGLIIRRVHDGETDVHRLGRHDRRGQTGRRNNFLAGLQHRHGEPEPRRPADVVVPRVPARFV